MQTIEKFCFSQVEALLERNRQKLTQAFIGKIDDVVRRTPGSNSANLAAELRGACAAGGEFYAFTSGESVIALLVVQFDGANAYLTPYLYSSLLPGIEDVLSELLSRVNKLICMTIDPFVSGFLGDRGFRVVGVMQEHELIEGRLADTVILERLRNVRMLPEQEPEEDIEEDFVEDVPPVIEAVEPVIKPVKRQRLTEDFSAVKEDVQIKRG
ncbi:MAG: hypothetical protein JSS82_15595 [Bacteroidetes bacterium]|nr:hypothetical protein [Bacteroidota bacterium]